MEDVELHGRHELQRILSEEAVTVKLPLLVLDGVVLFPGDTLPLMIPDDGRNDAARRMLATCVHAPPPLQGMFGIVHLNRRGDWNRIVNEVGTVAEMRQMSGGDGNINAEDGGGGDPMSIVAKGRLRFRVADLEALREKVRDGWNGSGTVACGGVEVELVGEESLAPPGPPRGAFAAPLVCGRSGGCDGKSMASRLLMKRKSYLSSSSSSSLALTPFSPSVYRMFDAHDLAARLHASPYLRLMCEDTDSLPRDPTALSFWVASHVPATEASRAKLLAAHSTVGSRVGVYPVYHTQIQSILLFVFTLHYI